MGVKFVPIDDRVLVSVVEQERILEGVLLPDSTKEDMQVGLVVAVGKTSSLKEGDHVMMGPWAGKNIQIEGIPFRVMREAEIDGVLEIVQ